MSEVEVTEEERFSSNMEGMISLVVEMVTLARSKGSNILEPAIIQFVGSYLKQYEKPKLLRNFIIYSKGHWTMIKAKKMEFFIEHAHSIFGELPVEHVSAFKDLVVVKDKDGNYFVPEQNIEDLWAYFHSLVKICIRYVHRMRQPYTMSTSSGVRHEYRDNTFFPELNIPLLAEEWGISSRLNWGPIQHA